jgi:cation diffusion facilitator family transporter
MSEQDTRKTKDFAAKLIFFTGIAILAVKFFAWYITDSSAIYSDALESIVNVITAVTAWIAIRISSQPADKDHPYGHGKVEYFSAGFEGILIILAGLFIVYEAVYSFIDGIHIQEITFGLSLIALTALINGILGMFLIRTGKQIRSETLIASGYHVYSDSITSFGVFVGLIIVKLTDLLWIDPVIALFVAVHIIFQGSKLVRNAIMRLMDSADDDALSVISMCLRKNRRDEWIAPHRLRAWRGGSQLFIDFHLIMPWYFSLRQTHDAEHEIKNRFSDAMNEPVELIIHTEPCFPEACRYCRMKNCSYRSEVQEVDSIWSKDILMTIPEMPKPNLDIL